MDNKVPFFSIIIPLFNRRDSVLEAITSVLSQSFQDFEIIVVDDGSNDDGATVVEHLEDPRIRCIRQANAGANAARNRGIDEARGRFTAFLDSDDRYLPDHLARTASALEAQPHRVVFSRVMVARGEGLTFLKPPRAPREDEDIGEYYFCARGFIQTSTVALATENARRVRYLDGLRTGQDTDFAIRLAAAGHSFQMIEEPGAMWSDQRDPRRISSTANVEASMQWLEQVRPLLTRRARLGFAGWVLAKAHAREGDWWRATQRFMVAVFGGCYSPALAARIFLQIFLGNRGYRQLSDTALFLVRR
jgi:hypothetical protein